MRVGELSQLTWGDVDEASSRFLVRKGKTAKSRRWVDVPANVMLLVAASVPYDDRTADRKVFPGFTPDAARNAMDRACKAAGIVRFSPHDLRHRYASIQIKRGVPVTDLAAQLGHSRTSMTLDVYSHVVLDD